eukprot:2081389-Prymnesium_polylepis.1
MHTGCVCTKRHHSVNGSAACLFCAEDFYRPREDSPASACTHCDAIGGVSCGTDTVIRTLSIDTYYWLHSEHTTATYRCKQSGDWTPCRGGVDAGLEGDGYCEPGFHGPRCELCDVGEGPSKYFDALNARCHECGGLTNQMLATLCALTILLTAAAWSIVRRQTSA